VPAVHVSDAAQLLPLAFERGEAGTRYHAVAEEGIAMREIAEAISGSLKLPVRSITPDASAEYFGALAQLATIDLAASGEFTRQKLAWTPGRTGLLTDLCNMGA
jgi:nucleoside-diphosphate-sugar epimerase